MNKILVSLVLSISFLATAQTEKKPNIVVILADDLGYGDVSYHEIHAEDAETPNIDRIAKNGVHFTKGYVTASVCAPSRAGFITGRYQQRIGFESLFGDFNGGVGYRNVEEINKQGGVAGVPLASNTFAMRFKKLGYNTAMVGKWHLGHDGDAVKPNKHGFDEFFGFLGGASSYYFKKEGPLVRNSTPITNEKEYYTTAFTREAINYVNKQKEDTPFFLYLAYNAVHTPLSVDEKLEDMFGHIKNPKRKKIAYMKYSLDQGIGQLLDQLEKNNQIDNTIVYFFSDNGGIKINSPNIPLSGYKNQILEGGIRIPFCMQWNGKIKPGTVYDQPISSLDILPTSLAAAGVKDIDPTLDGANLLPYLLDHKTGAPHEYLYFRRMFQWAISDGEYKLLDDNARDLKRPRLYKIDTDIQEKEDIYDKNPEVVTRLTKAYTKWCSSLKKPLWGGTEKINDTVDCDCISGK